MTKPMLNGRELSEIDLAQMRKQIENLQTIDLISDEMRVADNSGLSCWSRSLPKLSRAVRTSTRDPSTCGWSRA
jgi:hypothetical protein